MKKGKIIGKKWSFEGCVKNLRLYLWILTTSVLSAENMRYTGEYGYVQNTINEAQRLENRAKSCYNIY